MIIRVLVNGALGRMGKETVNAVEQDPMLQLVAVTGRNDDLFNVIKDSGAQIVIDFSNAEAVYENSLLIIESDVHPVIGASGLVAEQITVLQKMCDIKKLGGIIAPNFSIAAILAMKFSREAARYFPHVEIIEMHHTGKLDAPSGTSLKTAEMIAETREKIALPKMVRETIPHTRGGEHHGIPIHAMRLPGGIVAKEQIIFGGQGEMLTIEHTTIERKAFMPGVCLACKKVVELDHLVYGLENIL